MELLDTASLFCLHTTVAHYGYKGLNYLRFQVYVCNYLNNNNLLFAFTYVLANFKHYKKQMDLPVETVSIILYVIDNSYLCIFIHLDYNFDVISHSYIMQYMCIPSHCLSSAPKTYPLLHRHLYVPSKFWHRWEHPWEPSHSSISIQYVNYKIYWMINN